MRQSRVQYLQLHPGLPIPKLPFEEPFRCVVVAEIEVDPDWQYLVSCWLLDSGCLYGVCWGMDSAGWEESMDHASILFEDRNQTPGDHFLMTTSHVDQTLEEAFWYTEHCAFDEYLELNDVLILHVSDQLNEPHLRNLYTGQ